MSWGQWGIWLSMVSHETWMPIGGTKRLEPGTTVEDVAEELRYLMARFPSMRTRLRFDADGRPTQELFDSGVIALEIYEADETDEAGPEAMARTVEARYRDADLDFAAHIEALARGMEEIAVEAAYDPTASTRVGTAAIPTRVRTPPTQPA